MIRVHATCVARAGQAVLLFGAPGSGKSDLALRLLDRGWLLVADDQVELSRDGDRLLAAPPPTIAGRLEVRGVGIVERPYLSRVPIVCAFDLAAVPERLPEPAARAIGGVAVPCLPLAPFEPSAAHKLEAALTMMAKGVKAATVPAATPKSRTADASPAARVLVVSGMSGAGKSTALRALEDLGYEAVDNLPLALIDRLLSPDELSAARPLAFGIDSRTRGFDADAIAARLQALRAGGLDVRLVFLDCAGGELTRRFSETRRRHPLALDRPAADGIAAEREMLSSLRRWADIVVDTTDYRAADLRAVIGERFGGDSGNPLTLTVMSFGFARGLPRDADLVFDLRFLANPHWDLALRPLTGEDAAVQAYVAADPAFAPAFERIADLLLTLLPGYGREGKAYLTVALGCTGGRHRSVFVATALAGRLAAAGYAPHLIHRDKAGTGAEAAVLPPLEQAQA